MQVLERSNPKPLHRIEMHFRREILSVESVTALPGKTNKHYLTIQFYHEVAQLYIM